MIVIDFVSVVKNEECFIEQMICSVFNSCPNFLKIKNFIIIDDHSVDKTVKIINDLSKKYNQITLLSNKYNNKVNGTFYGLSKTRSQWVKLIDGDDFIDLSHLSSEDFDCDAFYHDYNLFTDRNIKAVRLGSSLSISPSSFFYNLRTIPKGMFFFKNSLMKDDKIEVDKFLFEDIIINYFICKYANNIKYVRKCVYNYRQHNNYYGYGFKGNKKKLNRLSNRIHTSYSLLKDKINLNKSLPLYCDFLINYYPDIRLFFQPYLIFKALYYKIITSL